MTNTLPIAHIIPDVKATLHTHNKLVVQAPPGAGKTTALPLALLDEPWLKGKKIIMLQPRRLAVRTVANRMAEMLGEKVGERIGYQVKMEVKQSDATQLLIVTEGILTRKLQHDPALEDVALIIFDEFHERSLHAELSLALALESQSILREDLKLLVMSATLNTQAIATLLDDAPIIESQGRSYPVERLYLDASTSAPTLQSLVELTVTTIRHALKEDEGNILVFLPGIKEITTVAKALQPHIDTTTILAPLYGNLSKEAQHQAIAPPPKGIRKVVLATNIAQTSLTIEGIKVVIDSGLQRVLRFNPFTGMDTLETVFISEESATQRAGRAGRLSEGKCYHLWHKSKLLSKHDTPEILQADLTPLLLELKKWGCNDVKSLSWLDTPPKKALDYATTLLQNLGALDAKGQITPHGEAMGAYGIHPRLAHMMLQAKKLNLGYEASLLAVLTSEKEIFSHTYRSSNLKERVQTLHDVAQHRYIDTSYVDLSQCHYLLANAKRLNPTQSKQIQNDMLGILLAFAYPDRIAQLRQKGGTTYLLSNGKGAHLHPDDTLFNTPYLVVSNLNAKEANATIYQAISVAQNQLQTHMKTTIQQRIAWNETQERVEVQEITAIGKVTLHTKQLPANGIPEVTRLLLAKLKTVGLEKLTWSKEAKKLQERVLFLHYHNPDFPNFSNDWLEEHVAEWLAPYTEGMSSLKELQSLNLYPILLGLLSYKENQMLNQLAPATIKVASGSNIAINYNNPKQPILAVRLQEMFGTTTTPTILNGKVKLMLHLLSPAHRPMQVTQDLANFWATTYDEVKKELRGKYKKHYWPDNPLEATATNKTKKHM